MPSAEVVIVGAGPVGLLLAGDLAQSGIECVVLDHGRQSKLTRAFVVHARTLEQLDARGVAQELIDTGTTVDTLQLFGRLDLDLTSLPSRFRYLLSTPQYNTERVLAERATRLGARLLDVQVTGLTQDADGADVHGRAADGTATTWRARYVVGCDGVKSAVRRAVGLPFPGKSAIESVMLADVKLTHEPERDLVLIGNNAGFAFFSSFGDGWHRVIAWDRHRQFPDNVPVTLEEVGDIARRTFGSDFGMHDPRWLSRFHSDERQVPRYRVGRVFVAGDAAHVHTPAGGQGMNTGLQDAANLGWKLAAVLHDPSMEHLLDTYHAERHPVGRSVLRTSGTLLAVAVAHSWPLRLVRKLAPAAFAPIPPVRRQLARAITGLNVRYPRPRGAHRLTGRRAPDLRLNSGATRLYEVLRERRFVLIAPEPVPGWEDRVVHAEGGPGTILLVRPDGYIAWAGSHGLRDAMKHWCGSSGIEPI